MEKGQFSLDLFGGAGGVASAVQVLGGQARLWDIAGGKAYDLSLLAVARRIVGMMRRGEVSGLMVATPCGTFAIMQLGRFRSADDPFGPQSGIFKMCCRISLLSSCSPMHS